MLHCSQHKPISARSNIQTKNRLTGAPAHLELAPAPRRHSHHHRARMLLHRIHSQRPVQAPKGLVPADLARGLSQHPRRARRSTHVCSFAVSIPAKVVEKEKELELLALPPLESPVDDLSLHNPLKRAERLSTGWFGVIMEYEGVLIEDTNDAHQRAWLNVAAEFGFPRPLGHTFRRIKGVRDEVVVTRVFNWTQNMTTARQIAKRKQALYEEELGGRQPAEMLEAKPFLEMLRRYQIPVAVACALPEAKVKEGLSRTKMQDYFDAVVTAEDSGAPEVEYYYSYASQQIQRPPIRCIVFGESNNSVEAAHELGMKCVVVTGNKPVYDFIGADLVVRNLSQVTFFNLKRLFGAEDLVAPRSLSEEGLPGEDDIVDDPELDDFEPSYTQSGAFF